MKSPAFQIYPADFLADANTLVMSAAEVGAYWLLLCVCWRENGLPDDLSELADLARTPAKQFQVSWEKRLQRCFMKRDDGMWTHNRLEKERVKQSENRKKRQTAGTKGAAERWQTDSNAMAMPLPNPNETKNGDSNRIALDGLSSSSSSSEERQQRATRTPGAQGSRLPEDFSVTTDLREWAREHAPHVDLETTLGEFHDYWKGVPGAKGRKLDWPATFRNRLRELEGRKNGSGLRAVPEHPNAHRPGKMVL